MFLKRFTFILGSIFLIIGVLGFVPRLITYPATPMPETAVHAYHGLLFGLFPVNAIHNAIHIAFGLWALLAARSILGSQIFCRANSQIYGALAVFGLIPYLNTFFGLVPLHGHDVWLHAGIALATGYFGYAWDPSADMKTSAKDPAFPGGTPTMRVQFSFPSIYDPMTGSTEGL